MAKDQNTSSTDKVALKQPGSVTANSFLSELSPPTMQPGQREGSHGLVTKQNTYDAFWARDIPTGRRPNPPPSSPFHLTQLLREAK